MYSAISKNR